jgi:enoyl-CoA hydratase/carnithine racemase
MTDLVLADLDADGVMTLTLNRPERRNGWTDELKDAYYARLSAAAADPDVRVAVLTGAGTTFCPGADISRLDGLAQEGAQLPHLAVDIPRTFPKPIIAAVNGACAGVGLVHALFCHIRFAAEGAKFSTSFARRGLVAEYGIAWTLPRLIGVENAMDLLISGRTFDAAEAKELGLVSRVVPRGEVLAAAQDYARDLARHCSPAAMSVIAGQVVEGLDIPFGAALQRSYAHVDRFIGGPDLREGLASFLEKRPPRFAPLGQGS